MKKTWVFRPPKPKKPSINKYFKDDIESKGSELIQKHLIPKNVKPHPPEETLNYLVDVFCKWHGNYFYFIAKYVSPGPNAISSSFEEGFARMEFVGRKRFNLAYKRYTGQWWEIYQNLTLEECFDLIKEEGHFVP